MKAEVINVGSEVRRLDTGKDYQSDYLDFKIWEVTKKEDCAIEKGQVYRITDNYQGMLKIGDKISAAISFCSSMGPAGPVSFLHWSKVVYEDGSATKNANNVLIDFLQSPQEPLRTDN